MKLLLIGLLAVLSLNSFAKEGGNGGDAVVTSDNAIRLRDLVDPGNCTWKSGKSILAQKKLSSILDKLMDANPHFSYKLQEQILKIKWCYTATLKKVDTNDDEETLTYYLDPYSQNKIQAGIRVVNNVYIDRSMLAANLIDGKITEEDRPYFYIHEAMHAFLYMKTPNRNKRVRDAVKAIKDFYVGDTNADDLEAMIIGSNLLTLKIDSPMQDLTKILIDGSLTVDERVQKAKSILSPELRNEILVQQWKEIETIFSDDELTILTNKTGLTRFEFVKRTRGNILLDSMQVPRFIGMFNMQLVDIQFGRCFSKLNDLSGKDNGTYLYWTSSPLTDWYGYTLDANGYHWLRVYDFSNIYSATPVIAELGRHDLYQKNSATYYVFNGTKGSKQVFQQFYKESICDFKPQT